MHRAPPEACRLFPPPRPWRILPTIVLLATVASHLGAQTTVYWDTDDTTAGAGGATPAGTWKTSGGANKNWSTSAAGTATTTVWTNDDIAVFSAGTDATGSYTVTVASAPTVDSIVIEEGNLTFNNSSLTLTGTTPSIDVASGLTATFNTKLLGSNGLVKTGSGTLLLASTGNNYTGDTSVSAGTLQVGTGASILPTATAVAVSSGATFEILAGSGTQRIASLAGAGTVNLNDSLLRTGDASDTTFSGAFAGTGTLRKDGTGTFTLSGSSSHTGALDLTAGTVVAANSGALGGASTGNDISTGAALHLQGGINLSETDLVIRSTGVAGTGVLRNLSGDNSLTAAITVASNSTITSDSGTLTLSGSIDASSRTLTADGAGNITVDSALTGVAGKLTKDGSGTLTLSGSSANTFDGNLNLNNGTLVLGKTAGVNAYAGSTVNIGDGTGAADSAVLRLDASNQIIDTAALVFASDGRLDLNGQAETVASIAGSGEIAIGTGQLTAGNALNTVFSGELTGTTGTFTKTGSGTLTLASTINYDGVFELAAGTLSLSGITANIGTLTLTGNSTIDFAGASILNVANLNLNGFTLNITNWTNATDYFFAANWSGAVPGTTGVAPMNQVTFSGFAAGDTKWQSYDNQVTPVPEPSTYGALLLGALTSLFAWSRLVRRPAR